MANADFSTWIENLRCPLTGGDLVNKDGLLVSKDQPQQVFPVWEGVPWLLRSPNSYWEQWQIRLQLLVADWSKTAATIQTTLNSKPIAPVAKSRLELLLEAHSFNQKFVQSRLQAFVSSVKPGAALAGFKDQVSATQHGDSYFQNVFRDWIWGQKENEASLASVHKILGSGPLGNLTVLGAGAGRLAYDIAQKLKPSKTFVVDVNPLLMAIAKDNFEGKSFELYEIPLAPLSSEKAAIKQRFNSAKIDNPNVHFLFGDATNLPLKTQSQDVVLTPWLIDILPMDAVTLAKHINRVLKPNGRWVFFGPLSFGSMPIAERFTIDELQTVLTGAGFDVGPAAAERIPYLQSPHDGYWRTEHVWSFQATKIKHVEPLEPFFVLPEWLRDYDQPIQPTVELPLKLIRHTTMAQVIPLIDGRRSVNGMAAQLAAQFQIPEKECRENLLGILMQIFEIKK